MTIKDLATRIAQNGLNYVEDGNDILAILEQMYAPYAGMDPYKSMSADGYGLTLRDYLLEGLELLDRHYDWDHPAKTDKQEATIYGFFVTLFLITKR